MTPSIEKLAEKYFEYRGTAKGGGVAQTEAEHSLEWLRLMREPVWTHQTYVQLCEYINQVADDDSRPETYRIAPIPTVAEFKAKGTAMMFARSAYAWIQQRKEQIERGELEEGISFAQNDTELALEWLRDGRGMALVRSQARVREMIPCLDSMGLNVDIQSNLDIEAGATPGMTARKFVFWMNGQNGFGSEPGNECLLEFCKTPDGKKEIISHTRLRQVALCLSDQGFKTVPPPTEREFGLLWMEQPRKPRANGMVNRIMAHNQRKRLQA